jgi:hypothetical protein
MVGWSGLSELEKSFTKEVVAEENLTDGGDQAEKTFASTAAE